MIGIVFSVLAGIFVAMQTVFNARVSEHVGLWETTTIVHLGGFLFSVVMVMIFGEGQLGKWTEINKLYLMGGAFGVMVIYSITRGVVTIGTTLAISILIVSQLTFAMVIDMFGLFGTQKLIIDWTKPLGIVIMVVGIIVYKLKG
jgi:transporter family-2 protein